MNSAVGCEPALAVSASKMHCRWGVTLRPCARKCSMSSPDDFTAGTLAGLPQLTTIVRRKFLLLVRGWSVAIERLFSAVMVTMTPVPVLSNPSARAGGGNRPMSSVTRALRFAGRSPRPISARSPGEVTERVRELIVAGEERVLLIGGDGLVHHAAQAAANSPLTLGIVPTGTGNDIARGLAIPTNVAGAIGTALIDQVTIDVLRVRELNGSEQHIVVSVCTLGFSGDVNERANRLRRPRGRFRYTAATMLEIRRLRALSLSIELD